jgi:hypothetical protein
LLLVGREGVEDLVGDGGDGLLFALFDFWQLDFLGLLGVDFDLFGEWGTCRVRRRGVLGDGEGGRGDQEGGGRCRVDAGFGHGRFRWLGGSARWGMG